MIENSHILTFMKFLEKRDKRHIPSDIKIELDPNVILSTNEISQLSLANKLLYYPQYVTKHDNGFYTIVHLQNTNIKVIPDVINVLGILDLYGSKIEKLPENLRILNYLDITNTPIKVLPKGLNVDGTLHMRKTSIAEFPDDIVVTDRLYMQGTPLAISMQGKELELKHRYPGLAGCKVFLYS